MSERGVVPGATPGAAPATEAGAIPPLDATASALFAACEAAWDDDVRHDKFLKYCSAAGLMATAALHYRRRLDQHPGDATATRMQQRIVAMASLLLVTHQAAPQPLTRSRWFVVFIVLAGVAGVVAAALYGR